MAIARQLEAARPLILLVEDEKRVASFIEKSLLEAEFAVVVAGGAQAAAEIWEARSPDIVILDIMLPDQDGIEFLQVKRRGGFNTPVLLLSAKSSMSERVTGLDAGADDYLAKPFGIEELIARVRVLLRRASNQTSMVVKCGDFTLDGTSRRVTRAGRRVFLSETEYRLLEHLASRQGSPQSKREILGVVWEDTERDDNIVEVYVNYLRNKLEWGGASRILHTVKDRGYVLAESYDAP
jgi:DNA-binding response OmpR family regulator